MQSCRTTLAQEINETVSPMIRRQRRSEGPARAILIVIAVVLLVSGAGWWWLRSRGEPAVPSVPAALVNQEPATLGPTEELLDLPALDGSDAFIRDLVTALSAHPQLASWLVTDELIRRFVGVVVDLAGGLSPWSRLDFLVPDEEFPVRDVGETMVLDPEGYSRYALLTETFVSLQTQGMARLYQQLYPLFEEAYTELGIPDGSFGDAMALAMGNLLSAEVAEGPLELQPNEAIYEFRTVNIEMRSPVEKHLIRMGPENTRRIQAKLRELSDAIAVEP